VAHNATGANMPDGAVNALIDGPSAPWAVLEIDELHVGRVADAVEPAAVVLLNLTRDQLDRGNEVRAVADSLAAALARHPGTLVIANADDPVVVGAVGRAPHVVWVAAGAGWLADAGTCPSCAGPLAGRPGSWSCACGLSRPEPAWRVDEGGVRGPAGVVPLRLRLPGRYNFGNAAVALAAADALGVPAAPAAEAIAGLRSVHGRYAVVHRDGRVLHLLLAKNPAGWTETLPLLADATALLLALNAQEADGRDTSWVWDVPFETLPVRPTVVSGERAADLGLRLSYAEREHCTEPDLLAALDLLPPGDVSVVANYTAFLRLLALVAPEEAA
jgi:UDP-N-acetylmuramyl tripeptide synthase